MKIRILISETDPLQRSSWAEALEDEKFEADQAESMRETLYRFCIQKPDLTVLSLNLPASDGLQNIAVMKELNSACPFLVLAADAEEYAPVVRPGIDQVLKKPVELPVLIAACKALTAKLRLELMENGNELVEGDSQDSPRRLAGGRHYRKRTPADLKTAHG